MRPLGYSAALFRWWKEKAGSTLHTTIRHGKKDSQRQTLIYSWPSIKVRSCVWHATFNALTLEKHALIGAIGVASFEADSCEEEPLSVLGMFVVRPEYRGKSVGSALFQMALKQCRPNIFLFSGKRFAKKIIFSPRQFVACFAVRSCS